MEDTLKFSFDVEPTNESLNVSILLDDKIVWQKVVDQLYKVDISCGDDDKAHSLVLRLNNKLPAHTKIDSLGNIINDSNIKFSNFKFDDIDISNPFIENAVYKHNFNGTGPDTIGKFFGEMGCNGTVEFKFTTPFYLWLLENM